MERFIRLLGAIAGGILVLMMLFTTIDVVMRYFFRKPLTGTTELTEAMMICIAFMGLSYCARNEGHLKVDLFMDRMPQRAREVMDGITSLISAIIIAIIAWRGFIEAGAVKEMKQVSSLLKIPIFPFYYVLFFGSAVFAFISLIKSLNHFRKVIKDGP